jgi:hypothetical protein
VKKMRSLLSVPRALAAVVLAGALGAAGCTTFTNARPLEPGQHAAAVTVGGPLTTIPGVGPIPLPNITVEGRSGVVHHLDVNYGVHLLPALFGAPGAHLGLTGQLFDQPAPAVPALSVGQRFFVFTNVLDSRKDVWDVYALSQTDLTASFEPMKNQLLYFGATGYLPLSNGLYGKDGAGVRVRFAPFAGVVVSPGVDWLQLNAEARWLGPSIDQSAAVVDWIGPDDKGAVAVNAGLSVTLSDLIGALLNDGVDAPPAASDEQGAQDASTTPGDDAAAAAKETP